MRILFDRLHGIYMERWLKCFPDAEAINNWTDAWAEAFAEERVTAIEVKRGLEVCRKTLDWPPTLPEFLKACRPSLNEEVAFSEAVRQMHLRRNPIERNGELVTTDVWSHPGIYWAAVSLGSDLMNSSYPQIKGRWHAALIEAMKDPQPVPVFRQAIPAPGKVALPPEEARKRIAEMMQSLGMPSSQGREVTE